MTDNTVRPTRTHTQTARVFADTKTSTGHVDWDLVDSCNQVLAKNDPGLDRKAMLAFRAELLQNYTPPQTSAAE